MSYRYSKSSMNKLKTCHPDLQKVFKLVLKRSVIDVTITYGLRTDNEQKKLYAKGRTAPGGIVTNCDGLNKKSKHQAKDDGYSHAIDISIYCSNCKYTAALRYDPLHLAYVAGLVESISKELKEANKITHDITWGGNWDRDGVIKFDQKMIDLCHWELK